MSDIILGAVMALLLTIACLLVWNGAER